MSVIGSNILAGASGGAGEDALYVDDVFSTYLYDGTGSAQTITNGVDLDGEGGLVWIKSRTDASGHCLMDTERTGRLLANVNSQALSATDYVTDFNSDGFDIGAGSGINTSNEDYVSWTFRKAPGFFDVVTYTGNGTAGRTVSHSLGSTPGMVIVKSTSNSENWAVWHRSISNTQMLQLHSSDDLYNQSEAPINIWNSTTPTSTEFTVGNWAGVNANNYTYVAYIFAHDDQSFGTNSDEAIIKCGTYEGNGGTQEINLGFEPQWLMLKNIDDTDTGGDWIMVDIMRGFEGFGVSGDSNSLNANNANAEPVNGGRVKVTSQGFKFDGESNHDYNKNNDTFVYVAIRRPNKPPATGTDVFATDTSEGTSPSPPQFTSGFPVDLAWRKTMNSGDGTLVTSRLQGIKNMRFTSTAVEDSASSLTWDFMDGWSSATGANTSLRAYLFKRAPGFFDVVAADYPSSSAAIPHNLGVAPELIINKPRDGVIGWMVGSDYLPNTNGWDRYIELNSTGAEGGTSTVWNQTAPTATHFTLGSYPGSSYKGIFYLFATLAGISKVGSYSGDTGNNVDVNCGFSAGARFVLIKRTDAAAHWYLWDSARGIVSGNDPYYLVSSTSAETTTTDYIDPLNSGFTVTSSAPAALNASGGTYLFLAIA